MHWPRRGLRSEPSSDAPVLPQSAPEPSSHDDIVAPDVELEKKAAQMRQLQDSLGALENKITSVKKEYNEAVGNLFDTRNELATKRREIVAANSTHDTLQRRIGELDSQLKESETHRAEIHTNAKERQDAARELAKINTDLDKQQLTLEAVRKKTDVASLELESVQDKTKTAHEKLAESGALLQKARAMTKDVGTAKPAPSSDVIRAASSMVASLNDRLAQSNKEIGVLRGVLDKERREHATTKSRLAELERKKD